MLKQKSKIGIASKDRKQYKAFVPDPEGDDDKPINLNLTEIRNKTFSQK